MRILAWAEMVQAGGTGRDAAQDTTLAPAGTRCREPCDGRPCTRGLWLKDEQKPAAEPVRHVLSPTTSPSGKAVGETPPATAASAGIQKIRHVVIVMQENRSFDPYFGTFPGADGIPIANGQFAVCQPDPKSSTYAKPYHDTNDKNGGGPHAAAAAIADIDGGKLDGSVLGFPDGMLIEAYFFRQRMGSRFGPFVELIIEGGVNKTR